MNKILVVASTFAPAAAIGGRRMEFLTGELSRRSWEVSVLTCSKRMIHPIDPNLQPPKGVNVIRVEPNWKLVFSNFNRGSNRILDTLSQLTRKILNYPTKFLIPDKHSLWIRPAIERGKKIEADLVLATGPLFSSFSVAYQLSKDLNIPLVLDYRDPWTFGNPKELDSRKRRCQKLETSYLDHSDLILTTSPSISAMISQVTETKVRTLFTGVIENEGQLELHSLVNQISDGYLVYLGSIAYGRSLSSVLRQIKKFNFNNSKDLRLVYAGDQVSLAKQQALEADAEEVLISSSRIPRIESLQLLKHAVASIVIGSPGYEYAIPGKIFDAVALVKPILMLGSLQGAASEFVRNYALGNTFEMDDDLSDELASLTSNSNEMSFNTSLSIESMCDTFIDYSSSLVTKTN